MIRETRSTIINRDNQQTESRLIEGYAVVFDSMSEDLGGFREIIARGAITQDTINNSDVLFLLNHNADRGILARSNKGNGSLKLEVDEKGLKFSFEAPKTTLGDEVLEGIKRGDISKCSFAFTVQSDTFEKQADDTIIRTINTIGQLYDASVVYFPAYPETTVDTRSFEKFIAEIEKRNEEKETEKDEETDTEVKEDETQVEEKECGKSDDEQRKEETEQPTDTEDEESSEENEEKDVEENETENEKSEDDKENEETEDEERKINNNDNIIVNRMKKNFSLIKTINDVVEGRSLNEVAEGIVKEGRAAAAKAGVTVGGQIVLPFETEKRFEDNPNGVLASQNTEAVTYGGEVVPTETYDLLGALRDKLVVAQLGARMINATGNIEVPVYDGANCTWESEVGDAKDGAGKFKSVKLSPKRLTAILPISKQFLIQTSDTAEQVLRDDLIAAISEKLQKTMFGDGAGDNVTPAGLFNGVSEDAAAFTYADAVNMEELLEARNVNGQYKYVMHPTAKALLRTTNIDKGSGKFVFADNQVIGVDAYSTNSVVNRGVIVGDWSNLYVATFGAIDLTVDPYTAAGKGQVILTVNAYFDYAPVRDEAFVKRIIKG